MKVNGLDGKTYAWTWSSGSTENCSEPHRLAKTLLRKIYTVESIYEEVQLPGSYGLIADFYLPQKQMIVEVHGKQHYKFIPHFHVTYLGFLAHKKRDQNKRQWCEINNISYVELPDNEGLDEWTRRILDR